MAEPTTCLLPIDEVGTTADLLPLLDAADLGRYRRYTAPRRAAEFLAGRALVRRQLAPLLGCEPRELHFTTNGHDKPELSDADGWHFNLSHSAGHVLVAWARTPIGCDLQAHGDTSRIEALAQRWFHRAEAQQLAAITDGNERRRRFFTGWARKEAVVKLLGTGIAGGLQRFCVDLLSDQPQQVLVDQDILVLTPVAAGAGMSAAVAVYANGPD